MFKKKYRTFTSNKITTENVTELTDIEDLGNEFFRLFGFGHEDLDYDKDIEQCFNIPNIVQLIIIIMLKASLYLIFFNIRCF